MQDPYSTQGYNRYSYALNNPLKYTDPDGEWVHLVIGAVAGALGAGIGAGISSGLAASGTFGAGFVGSAAAQTVSTSFASGAVIGMGAGAGAGFVSGFGNSLVGGQNFGEAFVSGIQNAFIGAVAGGIIGGLAGGIDAAIDGRKFWDGGYKTYKIPDATLTASTKGGITFNEDGYTVQNRSGETIYYKPESKGIKNAFAIKDGEGIKHAIDGVTAPGKSAQVFKVTNPFNTSSIRVSYSSVSIDKPFIFGELTLNKLGGGGWLTTPPDQNWHQIFKIAGYVFK
ncbi:MAG: hypothetical protein DRH21_04510 [Deltaproteobacteria bacterium]|nr:MAG: hypothetical protein DRH21_04510 [Deltaproteobacteria bacterium]